MWWCQSYLLPFEVLVVEVLGNRDELHTFLLQDFDYRINQAGQVGPHTGSLPLPADPAILEPFNSWKANRLREFSSILEPAKGINALFNRRAAKDELDQQLRGLFQVVHKQELEKQIIQHYYVLLG